MNSFGYWTISAVGLASLALACPLRAQEEPSKGQVVSVSETDPNSPRKSRLKGSEPDQEVLHIDLDNDGDPDVLERWWHGRRVRWIDENDDMTAADQRGDMVNDSLQIDRDGDGYYDGPNDMNVKWSDEDDDGLADLQIVTINPSATQSTIRSGASHYMVFIDIDKDGVNGYIDWEKFDFANWRTTGRGNYSPDYNGNAIFLKQHLPAWALTDPRYNWENPFAFYDFDGDGLTEMAIRLLDYTDRGGTETEPAETYSGKISDAYNTFDLDNDNGKDNEFDFDMSIRMFSERDGSKGDLLEYERFVNRYTKMRAPDWVLPLFRYDNYRRIDELVYVPHEECFDEMWGVQWGSTWFVFDEDDDDHRWERVEFYYPTDNVYSTKRWREVKDRKEAGLSGHPQADSLGDRGEWDQDNSGRGKLYIGRWDQKLHLYGAENGVWLVDYGGKYWGGGPVQVGGSSKENAPQVEEVVQYRDTNDNGFFDEITFDYDGDQTVDLKISLLDYADAQTPYPDVAELINPADERWEGLHKHFRRVSARSFRDALLIYQAAWKKDLTDTEIDDLAIAASIGEMYHNGYWLKEKIFRRLDQRLANYHDPQKGQQLRDDLRRHHFMGSAAGVIKVITEYQAQPPATTQ